MRICDFVHDAERLKISINTSSIAYVIIIVSARKIRGKKFENKIAIGR